jgi:serine protease
MLKLTRIPFVWLCLLALPSPAVTLEEFQRVKKRVPEQVNAQQTDWHLYRTRVIEAWKLFPNRVPGSGVTIAVPDTGLYPHPELTREGQFIPEILMDEGYDFYRDRKPALDELNEWSIAIPQGHGTSVTALLVSPPDADPVAGSEAWPVTGVVPGAKVLPLRVQPSVLLTDGERLGKALRYAIDKKVDVISISMGGLFFDRRLEQLLQEAEQLGIIVVAAGGQGIPEIIYPASSQHVIAVAASDAADRAWSATSSGAKILVSAPGNGVWYAGASRANADEPVAISVRQGQGTSFAAPLVAGAAAMWLSYHGRESLLKKYGGAGLVRVFKHLVMRQATNKIDDWDSFRFGLGVIDYEKLLKAPLPYLAPEIPGGFRIDPFGLANFAYRGRYESRGISGYINFCFDWLQDGRDVTPILEAAKQAGDLWEKPDSAFRDTLRLQIDGLCES